MSEILSQLIDVRKLDKSAFFEGKEHATETMKTPDGKVVPYRPLYARLDAIPRKETGQYGDTHLITQDIGKDRRLAGEKGPIVGNGKPVVRKSAAPVQSAPPAESAGFDEGPF